MATKPAVAAQTPATAAENVKKTTGSSTKRHVTVRRKATASYFVLEGRKTYRLPTSWLMFVSEENPVKSRANKYGLLGRDVPFG
jgi:hypothetical protein